ncbi:MAG TPA: phage major capsid protein [Pirellulales bacterium]|jgi:HK97 family phage major capsid protein
MVASMRERQEVRDRIADITGDTGTGSILGNLMKPSGRPAPANFSKLATAAKAANWAGDVDLCPDYRQVRNDLLAGSDQGGYLQSVLIQDTVEQALLDNTSLRSICTVVRTWLAQSLGVPTMNGALKEGSIVQIGQPAANQADPVVGRANAVMTAFGSGQLALSRAFQQDSPLAVPAAVYAVTSRVARIQNRTFTLGESSVQQAGFLYAAPVKVTTGSPGSIAADEILSLVGSIPSMYAKPGVASFMCTLNTYLVIRQLKNGLADYIFRSSGLDEWRWTINQHMPEIAAGSVPIAFGDFSKVTIVDFGPIMLQKLGEMRAERDEDLWQAIGHSACVLRDAGTHPIATLQMHA